MSKSRSLTLLNQLGEIARIKGFVGAFGAELGLSQDFRHRLTLALEELVTNVIRYGYDDDGPHDLQVTLSVEGDRVIVTLEDDGRPFDPSRAPRSELAGDPEQRRAGGLGLRLVDGLMDSIDYARAANRNRTVMSKRMDG